MPPFRRCSDGRRLRHGFDVVSVEFNRSSERNERCRHPCACRTASAQDPIRVMIVDDAVVVRGLVSRWIDEEPDLKTVASLRTGRDAVDQLSRINPDVVLLDIDMPDLDGLTALPLLLEKKRDLIVIMASTLTRRNAEVSLKALSLGAADYIPKPATQPRSHHLGDLPPRPDRKGPPARRAAQTGAGPIRAARAVSRRSPAAAAPGAAARKSFSVAEPRTAAAASAHAPTSSCGRSRRPAARAADRLLDRRPAGADRPGRADRADLRPWARCGRPAW